MKKFKPIFGSLFKLYFYLIAIFFATRLILFAIYFDRTETLEISRYLTFIHGLRMDTIIACSLLVIPTIFICIAPAFTHRIVNKILVVYTMVILAIVIYLDNASIPFMAQFDTRPNHLFIEYVEYPKEVLGLLMAKYKLALFFSFVIIFAILYLFYKFNKTLFEPAIKSPYWSKLIALPMLLIILFIGIRSSFGHRPANNSDAAYSSNRIVNEITKNSSYNVAYAIYSNKQHGTKSTEKYGKIEINEAIARSKKLLQIKSLSKSFLRKVKSHFKDNSHKNLVIYLQESVGAQFVQAIGGEPGITPNFNRLSKNGLLFNNLYSNGTRSVRGIAGVTSGFLAVPGKGVVKRNKSQTNFFTVASLLKPFGYRSVFLYGGESRFDNMRSWFLGNGFDKIIDQPQFADPAFTGTWGVSDEDLAKRANQEFIKMHKNSEKFVAVIFTTSNHTPFDFPPNRIEKIPGTELKSVKNAIKYADYALGEFFSEAQKQDYYKDTIFVAVSDHNVRVYGDDLVPVSTFRIPGLILGEGVPTKTVNDISSQPDILATALDLIGIDLEYPILGNSIFKQDKQNFAFMKFNNSYALMQDNQVAVVQKDKPAQTFSYQNKLLQKTRRNTELEKNALSLVFTLQYLYDNYKY